MNPCPQEGKIDAYLMGKLGPAESDAFEDHYFNCPACFQMICARNELVDVIQCRGAAIFAPTEKNRPALDAPKVPMREKIAGFLAPRPWVAAAGAAAVLLAVIAVIMPRSTSSAPVFSTIENTTLRGASIETIGPAGTLAKAPEDFAWRGVAGAAEYGIILFKGSELVWSTTGSDVRVSLPDSLAKGFEAGASYAWQVKAYSAQGTMLCASARTEFTIAR